MRMGVWLTGLTGLACLLLLLPAASVGQRHRRQAVHKPALTPINGAAVPLPRRDTNADVPRCENCKDDSRAQFLDVRRLLQLVFSQPNTTGHAKSNHRPELNRHMDAAMAELVAVQTLQGDVAWIEAKFVNESHQAGRRRRTRPYSYEERMALLLPVAAFLLPFVVWVSCMLACIHRSAHGKSDSY
ncbi:unnamed protein product [Ixodes hexagonus]